MNVADLRGVGKTFRARRWWQVWEMSRTPVQALTDVNLEIREGETLSIIGANGSGKTTLMKILAGLLFHDEGSVMVAGHRLPDEQQPVRTRVHYLAPDERSFYHRLTVRDNLKLFATLMDGSLDPELLDLLRLHPLLNRRFGALSSGQKQRVALARALSARGSLYLLDEPTRSLDTEGAESLTRWLHGAHRNHATVVMAFPREDALMSLSDRVLKIEGGHVEAL
ncbi:MAG TPA: ABC transporter ATP-binding protein [Thermoanaerobaculia bacterium]|nr:ABC transporter ATP-binding protein [Thermoanaerobaculia bacterium]HUM29712.1 ABC transporter ATP-binding protein [Thermoanaerobaculia bacterium]HXK67012.1 ABC transporter ATP-binding protein [Thermoanaerobaculia bacterium]